MARCGCAGSCDCLIVPGQGITVGGNGGIAQPYRVGAYMSRDAGNCARFGSDGGFYAPCSDEEAADICGISVGNLPEQRVVFARGGAGRLLAPDHMLSSFRRAVDLGLDAIHAHVRELGDGTPVCYPTSTMDNRTGISDTPLSELGVERYKTVTLLPGWQPKTTAENPGPFPILGRRHGTFGFVEPDVVGAATLAEVLAAVGRRAVVLFQILPDHSPAFPQKVLSLIFRYCAQESVIMAASSLDELDVFVEAGIPACYLAESEAEAAENPPQALVERGVEWMAGRLGNVTTDQFIGYQGAGIQVVGFMASRHYWWNYLDSIGARGVISDDGLYMTMNPDRYRSPTMSETLRHPQAQPGMFGFWNDQRYYLDEGPGAPGQVHWPHQSRGFYYPIDWANAARAFYMPPRGPSASGIDEYSGTPYRTNSGYFDVTTGWMNPVPWPDDYTIDLQVSFRDTPAANRHAGMIIGATDDRSHDERLQASQSYWLVGIWWNGNVFATRYANGQVAENAFAEGPQLTEDEFYRLRVIVTPSDVTTQRLSGSGEVEAEATATTSQTRGPYTALYKHEVSGGTWVPYGIAWRDLEMTPNDPEEAARLARLRSRESQLLAAPVAWGPVPADADTTPDSQAGVDTGARAPQDPAGGGR